MDARKEWNLIERIMAGDFDPNQPRDENGRWTDTGAKAEIPEDGKAMIRQLKLKKMLSKYNPGTYASYSPERMASELRNSMATFEPDYAQDYIAWVDPNDFLYATVSDREGRQIIEQQAGELDLERLQTETQSMYLNVDMEEKTVTGHEGRHRMAALAKAGVEKVPVLIHPRERSYDRYHTEPIRAVWFDGQRFGDGKGTGFWIHNAIPLSERYQDAVKDLFTSLDGSVQF